MSTTPPADGYGQPDYGQQSGSYSSDPSGSTYGAPPTRPTEMPASVAMAVKLLWASIGLSLLSAVISFTMLDSIVDQAVENAAANNTEISTDVARSSAIVGVAFAVIVGLALTFLLLTFIKKGANWARIVYTVIGVLGLLGGLFGLFSNPPALILTGLVGLGLTVATLFFLWKKESAPWFTTAGGR